MPRSFLITNKRYRGDVTAASAHLHSNASGVSALDFRPIGKVIGLSDERRNLAEVREELEYSNEGVTEGAEIMDSTLSSKDSEEDAIEKLYRGMKDCQLQFAFLPELLLTAAAASPLSTKSVFYGLESDHLKDSIKSSGDDPSPTESCPTDPIHSCPECGKAYSTTSNLARHRQTHRSADDKKARKCPHCDKLYFSSPAYSMHVRTHNQGCACPHCGKRFSRPWLLQGHIRTHTGEKPFECPKCGKTFADKSNLRAHIQTHSSEKPYVCGRCGKGFALKSYLYKHEESSCMRSHRLYHHHHHQSSFHSHYQHRMTNAAAEVF